MSDTDASGNWHVAPGAADDFVARWREFLGWTRQIHPGLKSATLIRAESDPQHFISFATWASTEERNAWKQSEGFMERFSECRRLCNDFGGGDYTHVVEI